MDKVVRISLFAVLFFTLASCRSEAEVVASFCIRWDKAVEAAQDCGEMSSKLGELLDEWQGYVWGNAEDVCKETTACLPCKSAAKSMLARCGQDDAFRSTLNRFHFSRTLQQSRSEEK